MIASTRTTRQVWAYYTRHPAASVRECAIALGKGIGTVHRALGVLYAAGYLTTETRQARVRRIVVPLYTQETQL